MSRYHILSHFGSAVYGSMKIWDEFWKFRVWDSRKICCENIFFWVVCARKKICSIIYFGGILGIVWAQTTLRIFFCSMYPLCSGGAFLMTDINFENRSFRSMRRSENDWMRGISKYVCNFELKYDTFNKTFRSATLFSKDSCRKTILDRWNFSHQFHQSTLAGLSISWTELGDTSHCPSELFRVEDEKNVGFCSLLLRREGQKCKKNKSFL